MVAYLLKHIQMHSAWNKLQHGVVNTDSGYMPVNTALHIPQCATKHLLFDLNIILN